MQNIKRTGFVQKTYSWDLQLGASPNLRPDDVELKCSRILLIKQIGYNHGIVAKDLEFRIPDLKDQSEFRENGICFTESICSLKKQIYKYNGMCSGMVLMQVFCRAGPEQIFTQVLQAYSFTVAQMCRFVLCLSTLLQTL